MTAIFLERACRAFFEIKATGLDYTVPGPEELDHHAGIFGSDWFIRDNWGYFVDRLAQREG